MLRDHLFNANHAEQVLEKEVQCISPMNPMNHHGTTTERSFTLEAKHGLGTFENTLQKA
jgi:hypothetical protein